MILSHSLSGARRLTDVKGKSGKTDGGENIFSMVEIMTIEWD